MQVIYTLYLYLCTVVLLYMIIYQETLASEKPALFTVSAKMSSPSHK